MLAKPSKLCEIYEYEFNLMNEVYTNKPKLPKTKPCLVPYARHITI